MAEYVVMPKLGMTMVSGTITRWLKKEGDAVKIGEPLFDLESDKLSNTCEAMTEGVLRKILVQEGEEVPILANVAIVGAADEDISQLLGGDVDTNPSAKETESVAQKEPAALSAAEGRIIASPRARKVAEELGVDLTLVRPTGPGGRIIEKDVRNHKSAVLLVVCGGRINATPRARKVAQELGIDLVLVNPTGRDGRITEEDVRNYKAAKAQVIADETIATSTAVKASPMAARAAAALGIDLTDVKKNGRVMAADLLAYLGKGHNEVVPTGSEEMPVREEIRPMNNMRKAIARNMLASYHTSPMITINMSVEMDAMRDYREQLKESGLKVSYTDLLVKFVAQALRKFPILNSSVEDEKIVYKNYINMGVAVALDNGLVVPNITDADKKGLTEISVELKELSAAARAGTLDGDKMRGGTFTITNLGMYGVESSTPIINQPEVGILGVSTMEEKMVIRKGEPVIRLMMTLSLTVDHRVIDGAVAAQFLQYVKTLLEKPAMMLA